MVTFFDGLVRKKIVRIFGGVVLWFLCFQVFRIPGFSYSWFFSFLVFLIPGFQSILLGFLWELDQG